MIGSGAGFLLRAPNRIQQLHFTLHLYLHLRLPPYPMHIQKKNNAPNQPLLQNPHHRVRRLRHVDRALARAGRVQGCYDL